jgi:hypothetical protein
MTSDTGSRQSEPPKPDFELPELLDVRIRKTTFRARDHRHFQSALIARRETVEFTVKTDRPFPIRALGPTLYVGKTALTECEVVEPTLYRFFALDPTALVRAAPIRLGWSGHPPSAARASKFRYREPGR